MSIKTSYVQAVVCLFLVCLAFVPVPAKADETYPNAPHCSASRKNKLDERLKVLHIENHYPVGQQSMLGEGWVHLGFTVTPAGDVRDVWLIDMIGAPIFAHAAAGAVANAKYAPPTVGGKPVEVHGQFETQYMIEGRNRAGVHAKVASSYDLAKIARDQGDYRRSIEILKENLKLVLNMYEFATISYGMTVSYWDLGEWRRALQHARHTGVNNGSFADRGQRKSALAMLAELEVRDNNFPDGLCVFDALKETYPDFQATPQLQDALATARRELTATTPVRSEVELVESTRDDLPTMWRHTVLRPTLQFSAVQGNVRKLRLVCPTTDREVQFPLSQPLNVDLADGTCRLYVFGDPGAKFVLDER